MKTITWLFGKMGVGKTTYARSLGGQGARIVLVGQECRITFGAGNMAKMKNPGAPDETEAFVRKLVVDNVREASPDGHIVIDGMPRKVSQVRWIFDHYVNNKHTNVFVLCTCPEQTRVERLTLRDGGIKDDMALVESRSMKDSDVVLEVTSEIAYRQSFPHEDVSFCMRDTTMGEMYSVKCRANTSFSSVPLISKRHVDTPEVESVIPDDVDLDRMMKLNAEFSNITMARLGISMEAMLAETINKNEIDKMSMPVIWTHRFVRRAIDELQELLHELPESWWSADLANIRKARVELIDAWHFIMSASYSLGMDATRFVRAYYQKRAVNLSRQANGYVKRTKVKGDDDHVARADEQSNE